MSLGINLNSEQSYDGMINIMDSLHDYVPKKVFDVECDVNGKVYTTKKEVLHQLLFGGDQLTTARSRGCQIIRINSSFESLKLCGLHPVNEDWHTKVVLLQVSNTYKYTWR